MSHRTHRIEANGLRHVVRDSGEISARPVLLLHGFPDSSAVWAKVTPLLVAAGFRVVAPDLRGFGETDMAAKVTDYEISRGAMPDVRAILDHLALAEVDLVGHDFGSFVAWRLAAEHPERFRSLAALSVGHPRAYLDAGLEQKLRGLYILYHQLPGLCEATYRFNDWALVRRNLPQSPDTDAAIALLARPGRLTAGLNWYRANLNLATLFAGGAITAATRITLPTLGVWSSEEPYLVEGQMTGSSAYVDGEWRYARIEDAGHWITYDAPDELSALLIGHWRRH